MSNNIAATELSHVDLSRNYGCPASLTSAKFYTPGATISARRFYRKDMATTGKVEIYLCAPDGTEDFLGYLTALVPSRMTAQAAHLIRIAEIATAATALPIEL